MANKKLRFVVLLMVVLVLACTLVACVKPQTTQSYKVVIHPNNGSADYMLWDRTTEFPNIVGQKDYTFEGLYLDAALTQPVTVEELRAKVITADIDVYVKWNAPIYQATVHPQNGGNDVVWKVGDQLPTLTNPGYVVGGFYIDADCTKEIKLGEITALTENIEVWVKWNECDHKAVTDWTEDGTPTCTDKGHKHTTCPTCGEALEEDIPALGHTLTHHDPVAATCVKAGNVEYWSCSVCTKNFSDAKGTTEIKDVTVAINPNNHTFGGWVDEVEATCTTDGVKGHKDCTVCHKHFDKDGKEIENLTIPQFGHDFEGAEVKYEWLDGNGTCVATRVCKNDPSHDQHTYATVKADITQNRTCEKPELTTYTATFEVDWAETQVKADVETQKALGHDWDTVEYKWADDYSACTATRVCKHDKNHVETENVKSTSEITQHYNCVTDELTTFTATFENSAFETQTATDIVTKKAEAGQHNYTEFVKYVEGHVPTCTEGGRAVFKCGGCDATEERDVEALGHEYKNATVNHAWNDTHTACTATRKCDNCDHVDEATATVTTKVTAATCTIPETTVYTATFSVDWATTQTTNAIQTGDALGHDYNGAKVTYTWNADHTVCTATHTCQREGCKHEESATSTNVAGNVTQNQACGKAELTTFTATFAEAWAGNYEEKDVVTKPALDHDYEGADVTYSWNNAHTECTASHTCQREGCGHVESATSTKVEPTETQKQTCVDAQLMKYTATFAETWAGTCVKENVQTQNAAGHSLTVVAAKDSTCVATGNIAHYHCGTCGKNFSDAEGTKELENVTVAINPNNHTFGDWTDEVEETCVATGTKGHKDCTLCGKHFDNDGNEIENLSIAIDTTKHALEHHDAQAPTCTQPGWGEYDECTREGCSYTTKVEISATGHEYKWVDHTSTARAHYHCDKCDCNFDENMGELTSLDVTDDLTYVPEIDIEKYATDKEWGKGNSGPQNKDLTNVLFTIHLEGSQNSGKYYVVNNKEHQWRVYSSDKGEFTITAKEMYTIVSVTITFGGEKQQLTFNENEVSTGVAVNVGADEATFVAANGKVYITNIVVELKAKSDAELAQAKADKAAAALTCEDIQLKKDGSYSLTSNGENGETITWSIAENSYVTCVGNVLKAVAEPTDDNVKLTLTATVSVKVGNATATAEKTFENVVTVVKGEIQRTVNVTANSVVSITVTDETGKTIDTTVEGGATVADGTMLTIEAKKADGKLGTYTIVVKNNDEKLTANADGTYTVEATANVNITVETKPDLSTEELIVYAAWDLDSGVSLDGKLTLNGTVTAIDTYSVTIQVGELEKYPIVCYQLAGRDNIAIGDTIEVTGTLKNFYNSNKKTNTIEFDSGCTFDYTCNVDVTVNVEDVANAKVSYGETIITELDDKAPLFSVTKGSGFTFHIELEDGYQATYSTDGGTTKTTVYESGDCTVVVYANTTITIATETASETREMVVESLTLTFPDANNDENALSSYQESWTAKNTDGKKWTITNFNNNRWGNSWTKITCGRSGAASVASITSDKYGEAITKIVMSINLTGKGKVNKATLYVSTSSDFSNATEISFTSDLVTGNVTVSIPNAIADAYYKIEFDCASGSKNGFVEITKIEHYAMVSVSGGGNEGGNTETETKYTVNFESQEDVQLTVSANEQTIDAGQTGASVADGTVLKITATSTDGTKEVAGILVNGKVDGVTQNEDGTYSYTVTGNVESITVTLDPKQTTGEGGGDENPTGSKLELTTSTLFAGVSGTSYNACNGTHKVNNSDGTASYDVTTSNVCNNQGIQLKKSSGTITLNGTFSKVTITLSTAWQEGLLSVTVGGTAVEISADSGSTQIVLEIAANNADIVIKAGSVNPVVISSIVLE